MDDRCIRKLTALPSQPCQEGRKAVDAERRAETAGCPWFVNDAESNYCVWKYLADNGAPTQPAKIARLCMIDDNEVKKIVQGFTKKMTEDGLPT